MLTGHDWKALGTDGCSAERRNDVKSPSSLALGLNRSPECLNCGHSDTHGRYGCEHERGDRWVDHGNGYRLVAMGPCGCREFEPEDA